MSAELVIRRGGEADHQPPLTMFDDAVAWLAARGRNGQWGTEPWSTTQRGRTRVHGLVAADGLHIAEADGEHARRIARQRGIGLLRVDCWAGGDGGLVAYYTGQGFTPTERFTVGDWPGQVLARRLAQPAVS